MAAMWNSGDSAGESDSSEEEVVDSGNRILQATVGVGTNNNLDSNTGRAFIAQHSRDGGASGILVLLDVAGLGRRAVLVSRNIGIWLEEFSLWMPFWSQGDANQVQIFVDLLEEYPPVERDVAVIGNILVVTWTDDNLHRLWAAFFFFLEDFNVLLQTMW